MLHKQFVSALQARDFCGNRRVAALPAAILVSIWQAQDSLIYGQKMTVAAIAMADMKAIISRPAGHPWRQAPRRYG